MLPGGTAVETEAGAGWANSARGDRLGVIQERLGGGREERDAQSTGEPSAIGEPVEIWVGGADGACPVLGDAVCCGSNSHLR